MASIVKRKNRYSVVYSYTDENGVKRQKWETFETNAEEKNVKYRWNLSRTREHLLSLTQRRSATCLKNICPFTA